MALTGHRRTESLVLKMQQVLHAVYAFSLLCTTPSYGADASEADVCTTGFMSVDRMDDILDNEGNLVVIFSNSQAILPEVNFICSGSILSWVFGAQWEGHTDSYTELQIWRPGSEDGVYNKVGSTTIVTEKSQTRIYQYSLTSPLIFQAGDVLGFYQPEPSRSQLTLIGEGEARGRQLGYYHLDSTSAASQLNISIHGDDRYQVFINAVTEPTDCGCGFMSVERMRLLLDLESIASPVDTERRQQITPDMRFTCDGTITKWIIGANWNEGNDDTLYPELQIWRNIGNDTYQKISGTFITPPTENTNHSYEYDGFSPIPVQTGDILGAFIPQTSMSRLILLSENMKTPVNYYLETDNSATESPYDIIDVQNMPSVKSRGYHPLVTVEIVRETTMLPKSLTVAPSPPPFDGEPSSQSSSVAAGIGGGIAAAVVLLITVLVLLIVVVCVLRRRQRNKALELPHEKEGSRVAMNTRQYHQTVPLDDLCEMPQKENREQHALYDQPPENDAEYAEVSRQKVYVATDPTSASPETYWKFDNPLYERN